LLWTILLSQTRSPRFVCPMLYIVKPVALEQVSPSIQDCLRVVPISQIGPLLQHLHDNVILHRKTAVYPHLLQHYTHVTREVVDLYASQYCQFCNYHQQQWMLWDGATARKGAKRRPHDDAGRTHPAPCTPATILDHSNSNDSVPTD
jgi:hypothetical protein